MKKILAAIAALAMVATVTVASSTDASAQFRRWGPAVGLGILGGVIIGSIIAQRYGPQYVVEPGWDPYPVYRAAGPVDCPGGYWARKQYVDQWGNARYGRPRFFCPEGGY